jgi:uncharacterized protein (DUF362 family)
MEQNYSRRELLRRMGSAAVAAGAYWAGPPLLGSIAQTAPVAVATCKTYNRAELVATLSKMFDQLGGLKKLVNGKTVAIKINLTGSPTYRVGYLLLGDTHYTNPQVIAATVHLMGRAGARRIRVLESPWSSGYPLQETMYQADWNPQEIQSAASRVEFENTNFLGQGKKYWRFVVPSGGYLFPAYELNHSYRDCDVFVSIAKLKEHATTGITLSMKNCFGMTPASIYGSGAGIDEPNENPKGGRYMLHSGNRQPSKIATPEKHPNSPREGGYRVPRAVVDLVAARPIDLQVVDGIRSIAGGEGPWNRSVTPVEPGVLIAGTNPVSTDAVCVAVMGFDPMADRGTPPFKTSDNMLRLAEHAGLGTRQLNRIEVVGKRISDVVFDYAAHHRRNFAQLEVRGNSPIPLG